MDRFTDDEVAAFQRDGFVIARGLGAGRFLERMIDVTRAGLQQQIPPVEYEAEMNYPGSPASLDAAGGRTIRRLKQAHSRDYIFTEWLTHPPHLRRLQQLLGPRVVCPLAHHNCIMTKQPAYSSATGWHQDIRYWSFHSSNLVNTWLALGPETEENGCLQVIPGSHRLHPQRGQLDDRLFFRTDVPENQPWLEQRKFVPLEPGDVLFFHCLTLHAATANRTTQAKCSVVFTFRDGENWPLTGTRSAAAPELLLTPGGD